MVENEDNEILLVQEGKEHVKGKWNLPSGGYGKEDEEKEETVREAAKRETKEETGLKVEINRQTGVYTRNATRTDKKNTLIIFEASKVSGELSPRFEDEILDAEFFPPEKIDELDTRIDVDTILKDYFEDGEAAVRPLRY